MKSRTFRRTMESAEQVGIVLFFNGYSDQEKSTYRQIGYLFLDEALGEFAVESQVGFVEFRAADSNDFSQSRPLKELPAQFDEYLGAESSLMRNV